MELIGDGVDAPDARGMVIHIPVVTMLLKTATMAAIHTVGFLIMSSS
jgi:hypothetical protein